MKGVLHYIAWDLALVDGVANWMTEALERWPHWLAVWSTP